MFCKKCGKRIPDEAVVCENCGTEIVVEETESVEIEEKSFETSAQQTQSQTANNLRQSSLHNEGKSAVECPVKEDAPRSEILCKKRKIKKKTIIIGAVALLVCVAVIVLTFPYIKNAFARIFMSSEDYFAYVVKNDAEDSAKSIANTLDSLKKSETEGKSATGTADISLEESFHAMVADVTSDVEIGGTAGSILGTFMDLSVSGMTDWIDKVSVDYDLRSDGKNNQSLLDIKVNDADFGTVDFVEDNEKGITHIGIPDYREAYFIAEEKEPAADAKPLESVLTALPEKELTEELFIECIECFAENVGDVEEKTKTMTAGDFSKKTVALTAEIDKNEMNVITSKILDKIKNDKDVAEIIKNAAESSGKSEDEVRKSLEKAFKDFNKYYADELKGSMTVTLYVDAKGKIIGTTFKSNKFEFSNYTIIKWFEIGNTIKVSEGLANIELVGNGKLEDNKVKFDYVVSIGGSRIADIKISDLDYKKAKEGLYDAKIKVTFDENVAKIGGLLFSVSDKDGACEKLMKYVPDISLDIGLKQFSADETSVDVKVNYTDKLMATICVNNKNGEKKKVEIPGKSSKFGLGDVAELSETTDIELFIDFLVDAEYPDAKKIESAYEKVAMAKSIYNFLF